VIKNEGLESIDVEVQQEDVGCPQF